MLKEISPPSRQGIFKKPGWSNTSLAFALLSYGRRKFPVPESTHLTCPSTRNCRNHFSEGYARMAAVPRLWSQETLAHLVSGGGVAGANKPENIVLPCYPVWIRECTIMQPPTRGKVKCFLTLETGIWQRIILWLKGGKKRENPE